MMEIPAYSREQEVLLQRLVRRLPADMLFRDVAALRGFLFVVNATPEPIMLSDWVGYLLGGEEDPDAVAFDSDRDAEDTAVALISLGREVMAEVVEDAEDYPRGCELRRPAIRNAEPDAPLSQWLIGALAGMLWTEDLWTGSLGQATYAELLARFGGMAALATRQGLEHHYGERAEIFQDLSLEEYAELLLDALPVLRGEIVGLAFSADGEGGAPEAVRAAGIGSERPCPCGSGREYRRCCGTVRHH